MMNALAIVHTANDDSANDLIRDDFVGDEASREEMVRFFVTDGDVTIGPVDADLLARGVRSGKVPLEASVWANGWERWCNVREFAEEHGWLPAGESEKASAKLARVSDLGPLQMPSTDVEKQSIADCASLDEAARKFFSLALAATGAECGWVHLVSRHAAGAMTTIDGIGPRSMFHVGRTIDAADQALRVARDGRTVLGEPIPGVVGSAVASRILATGVSASSVLMVPVMNAGQLTVMVELGSTRASGFSARDGAIVEQIARDLSSVIRKRGWLE